MAVARYLADKSALARLGEPAVAARLAPLIELGMVATCAAIELEVLYSTQNHAQYEAVAADRRSGFEWLAMPEEVWDRALQVQRELSPREQLSAVGIPDLLIAATAERHGVTILHDDSDFEIINRITKRPIEWIVERSSVP